MNTITSAQMEPDAPPGFIRCRQYKALLLKIRCLERRKMARQGYWDRKDAVLRMSFDVCLDCSQGHEIEERKKKLTTETILNNQNCVHTEHTEKRVLRR